MVIKELINTNIYDKKEELVILKGDFTAHSKVIVKIDNRTIERKVYYSKTYGLYILYKNRKYFFEDFSFPS